MHLIEKCKLELVVRKSIRLNSECLRIILEGHTSFSIQGVNLREHIEGIVKGKDETSRLNLVGRVRNLKDGRVEILCKGPDAQKLEDKLRILNDRNVFLIKDIKRHRYDEPEAKFFDNFTIEHSDDLSEMVWALRGAGQRFKESIDALEKINSTLENRDKKVAEGRLLTLYYEIIHNKKELDELNPSILAQQRFQLEALRSNIGSPVIPEPLTH